MHRKLRGKLHSRELSTLELKTNITYEHNNNVQYHLRNIREVDAAEIDALYDENATRVLVGCAPCQPFSKMRFKLKDANERDEKYDLLLEFGRLIEATHPTVISMENVPQIRETRAGKLKVSKKFIEKRIIENHFLEIFRKSPKSYVDKIRKSLENSMFSRL